MTNTRAGADGAGRRHHHGKDARTVRRGDDHRGVAGQIGLRRQRIELLRARRARHHLHAHGGHAARRKLLDERLVVEGVEKAHVQGPLGQEIHVLRPWLGTRSTISDETIAEAMSATTSAPAAR